MVCLADAVMPRHFPGMHKDFDSLFLPRPGAERFLGLPIVFQTLTEQTELPKTCDYYYDSPACHLGSLEYLPQSLREDALQVADACQRWEQSATLERIAEQNVPFVTPPAAISGETVTLTLYRVHSKHEN